MDKFLSRIERAISTLSYLVGSLVLLLLIGIIMNYNDMDWLSKFGGFIGGILGTVIAGIVFIYVKKTYNLQEQELRSTKEYIKKQQFESTFFTMLEMVYMLSKDFKPTDINHNNFFKEFLSNMIAFYNPYDSGYSKLLMFHESNNLVYLKVIQEKGNPFHCENVTNINAYLNDHDPNHDFHKRFHEWVKSNINNEEKYIGYLYEVYFTTYDSELGHFFRYIYNLIKFAIKERSEFGDESYYINLIQAQLSNYQLVVLFYNAVSPVSLNKKGENKFKLILDKYKVFENIQTKLLIDPSHKQFYPNTIFKY